MPSRTTGLLLLFSCVACRSVSDTHPSIQLSIAGHQGGIHDEYRYDRIGEASVGDPVPQQPRYIDEGRLTMAFSAPVFAEPEFDLRDIGEEWDSAERYEFHLLYHAERDIQVEPVTGMYVYYEKKEWDSGTARARHESVGVGLEAGALLYPVTHAPRPSIDFSFYPYARFGIGTNGGSFRNVPEPALGGTSSGDLGDFRVEGGLGADARLVIARRIILGAGFGVVWWDALDTAVVTVRDGTGVILIDSDDTGFDGRDTFVRFTVEIAY